MSWVMVGIAVVGAVSKGVSAHKDRKAREKEQDRANKEMASQKAKLQALDMSNPYANMQNTMEDLTINQQQVDYQTQQSQINQANTLQAMQGAAGGSGIGALAQSLYNQGAKTSQQIGAGIGQQERANQLSAAQMESSIQDKKAQGKQWSINKQQEAITGQLSAARADKASADTAANVAATNQANANQEMLGAVGGVAQTGVSNMQSGGNFFTGN
jgi:hypothetical protein